MSPPLEPFRHPWRTEVTEPGVRVVEGLVRDNTRHGVAFRALRVELGLGLREVAAGWQVSAVEVSALERGHRRFSSVHWLWAALCQLMLWRAQREREQTQGRRP